MNSFLIEACVSSVESALEAQAGGAGRVELCDNLHEGGTTPSLGAIRTARRYLNIALNVIIRPRGGDFLYSDMEFDIMKSDVLHSREAGADGVVLGILTATGRVDLERTSQLIRLAKPMSVTFHRAFDMTADPLQAMDDLISLGADRILTSGQRSSAMAGSDLIAELVRLAGHRIIIMPGVAIDEKNIADLAGKTGACEFHVLAEKNIASKMVHQNRLVFMGLDPALPEYETAVTDRDRIRAIGDVLKKK